MELLQQNNADQYTNFERDMGDDKIDGVEPAATGINFNDYNEFQDDKDHDVGDAADLIDPSDDFADIGDLDDLKEAPDYERPNEDDIYNPELYD